MQGQKIYQVFWGASKRSQNWAMKTRFVWRQKSIKTKELVFFRAQITEHPPVTDLGVETICPGLTTRAIWEVYSFSFATNTFQTSELFLPSFFFSFLNLLGFQRCLPALTLMPTAIPCQMTSVLILLLIKKLKIIILNNNTVFLYLNFKRFTQKSNCLRKSFTQQSTKRINLFIVFG